MAEEGFESELLKEIKANWLNNTLIKAA